MEFTQNGSVAFSTIYDDCAMAFLHPKTVARQKGSQDVSSAFVEIALQGYCVALTFEAVQREPARQHNVSALCRYFSNNLQSLTSLQEGHLKLNLDY